MIQIGFDFHIESCCEIFVNHGLFPYMLLIYFSSTFYFEASSTPKPLPPITSLTFAFFSLLITKRTLPLK
jgi:hypothetical protein